MKSRRSLFALAGFIAILAAIVFLLRGGFGDEDEKAHGPLAASPKSKTEASPEQKEKAGSARQADGRTPKAKSRPLAELKDSLTGKLKSMEAERISLLAERRIPTANAFLLGVEPPSPEEVKELRNLISTLQKSCSKEDLEQWDKEVEELLVEYDGFAEKGKKVILLRVEDAETDYLKAYIFWGADFDKIKREFEGGNTLSGASQVNAYPPDSATLKRFAAMMTSE